MVEMSKGTSILIPLGAGSRYNNIELRYCLRSIEKHLFGVGSIFIVGELPDFINPESVIFIPFEESKDNKHRALNIYNKIISGIGYGKGRMNREDKSNTSVEWIELSDNFLFMNDDHFLLSDFEASEFPYFHRGTIQTHRMPNEAQRIQYENTVKFLGGESYDFGLHSSILYNKHKFSNVFSNFVTWPPYGYEIKTMYANSIIDTTSWIPCEDLKFCEELRPESIELALSNRSWFSTGDRVFKNGSMQTVLEKLFPFPSKYEL